MTPYPISSSPSLRVFREHMIRLPNGTLDVSGVVSRACYLRWLDTKNARESDVEAKRFYRTLTNQVSGVDGRSPFTEEEETALLQLLRCKLRWPCFPLHLYSLGTRYRSMGFHEKQLREMGLVAQPLPLASNQYGLVNAAMANQFGYDPRSSPNIAQLTALADSAVRNYALPNLSQEGWKAIVQILRYSLLTWHAHLAGKPPSMGQATELCQKYSLDSTTYSVVYDLTAKEYGEHVLCENDFSVKVLGSVVGNKTAPGAYFQDLSTLIVAIGAAFHEPGRRFRFSRQRHWCVNGQLQSLDGCFLVDPDSLLLVVFGKNAV
ncbi:hypothetical protein BASA81_006773 [Batrachochytrium salamandrivorans]|nr:hypothetical protein BASA81_006773 [Batrachochytrium salamandrivorans]